MSSPYPSLQTVDLPCPVIWDVRPNSALQAALETRFKPLQTTYPGMIRFGKSNKYSPFLRFDHKWHLEEFIGDVPHKSGPFLAKARLFKDGQAQVGEGSLVDISGFCKITHLLDAYRMMQGNYPMSQHPALPAPGKKSAKLYSKVHDPHNQAYVDAVASYMLSKFREADHSPHFSLFYGAYLAIAKQYYYNITEDFEDMRFESWFWRKRAQGLFKFIGYQGDSLLPDDDPLMEAPDDLSSGCSSDGSSVSEIIGEVVDDASSVSTLHSASIKTMSTHESESESENRSESEDSDSNSLAKDIKLFAVLSDFPTMLIFLEANSETMDSLLDEESTETPFKIGTKEWEDCWSAWIFQVIAALCQIQSLWAMTHNDLHSNNILWTPTDKKFLYYKTRDGRFWKVPTYGKLFRIIDFGRAIYTHNGTLCISDDYWPENDAGTQYNFGPLYDPAEPRIYPNPSFDLCRLAVSILEGLFLEIPDDKDGGEILSDETDRRQMETVSPLFNVMWSWLIDDDGRNVLWDADQSERYPGFDLYRVIAQKIKHAVPREQLNKEPFVAYAMSVEDDVPNGEKVYSLFC